MGVRGGCAHDCPDTCAWEVAVEDGRAVKLAGLAVHPYTQEDALAEIPHGCWHSTSGGAPNDLTSDGLADLGGGGDFYGTRVEVARA